MGTVYSKERSSEARLRLSLIPLFMARHEYAEAAPIAADQVSAQAWITLFWSEWPGRCTLS